MRHILALALITLLAGCTGGFQKSLPTVAGVTDFRSALHIAGENSASRTVVYVVGLEDNGLGLMTHVARRDGRFPAITRARASGASFAYQRLSSQQTAGMMTESGLIALTAAEVSLAARTGMALELCGVSACYRADVPAGLFEQALVE